MYVIAMEKEAVLLPPNSDYIVTGVGGINVFRTLNRLNKNTEIINIGYVGSNIIPIGAHVKIGDVRLYHPSVEYEEPVYKLNGNVPCFTSCDFVTKTSIRYPCVFDMELAFILAMGFENVTSEKIVSDNLNIRQFTVYSEVQNGKTEDRD